MFCDGVCTKGNKRCGLLYDVMMGVQGTEGKTEMVTKCALHHIFDSLARQEQGQVRIQAATESARNVEAEGNDGLQKVVATGFLGLLHAISGNRNEAIQTLKLIGEG